MIRFLRSTIRRLINRINSIIRGPLWVVAWVENTDGVLTSEWSVMPGNQVGRMIELLRNRSEVTSYLAGPIADGTEPHWLEGRE